MPHPPPMQQCMVVAGQRSTLAFGAKSLVSILFSRAAWKVASWVNTKRGSDSSRKHKQLRQWPKFCLSQKFRLLGWRNQGGFPRQKQKKLRKSAPGRVFEHQGSRTYLAWAQNEKEGFFFEMWNRHWTNSCYLSTITGNCAANFPEGLAREVSWLKRLHTCKDKGRRGMLTLSLSVEVSHVRYFLAFESLSCLNVHNRSALNAKIQGNKNHSTEILMSMSSVRNKDFCLISAWGYRPVSSSFVSLCFCSYFSFVVTSFPVQSKAS